MLLLAVAACCYADDRHMVYIISKTPGDVEICVEFLGTHFASIALARDALLCQQVASMQ